MERGERGCSVRSRSRCGSCPRRGFQPGRADARVCPRERNRHPLGLANRKERVIENAHGYEAVSVSFDCDSKWLATAGGRDHSAYVWDVQTRESPFHSTSREPRGPRAGCGEQRSAPTAIGLPRSDTETVRSCMMIWDAATGERHWTIEGPGTRLYYLAFSPDGRRIAAAARTTACGSGTGTGQRKRSRKSFADTPGKSTDWPSVPTAASSLRAAVTRDTGRSNYGTRLADPKREGGQPCTRFQIAFRGVASR